MINIAFIKYAGMASGGIEKYLQTLACRLPKDEFKVDFFYTNLGKRLYSNFNHPDNDPKRIEYMKSNGINPIKISIDSIDCRFNANFVWNNSNFNELFDESKYDIIQTGRFGYREYPFYTLYKSNIVDSIHSCGQCVIDHGINIKKTVLLSEYQSKLWIQNGGDPNKIVIIPPIVDYSQPTELIDLRQKLGLEKYKIVCGMHQRVDDMIFSHMPLTALKEIDKDIAYVIMGGSEKYKEHARQLGLDNVYFVDFSSDASDIHNFLMSLDFYLHGRSDGEVCSASIIEALRYGLPVVSHIAQNNGHREQIEGCGFFGTNIYEYTDMIKRMINQEELRRDFAKKAREKYRNTYSLATTVDKYIELYRSIV